MCPCDLPMGSYDESVSFRESIWHMDSLTVARGLPGAWASVGVGLGLKLLSAHEILVPLPGMEPASPALQGGFLTTGPPWKSS